MTPVKFQCKRSGNFISFTNENDIAGLRKHEGYKEVVDEIEDEEVQAPTKEVLKRGRPAKVPAFLQG
jgi:hypothetical protein